MTVPNSPCSRVLVVTEDAALFELVAAGLAEAFETVWARDGWLGLEKVSERRFDLVVTDSALPRVSASGMVTAIREQAHLDGVPILVLSSGPDDPARAALLREGAQDYVVKPFTPEELRTRATNLASVKRLRDILQSEVTTRTGDLDLLAREILADKQRALQALRNAETTSAAKDEFLAVLSHELRSPLNAMLGWLAVLQRTELGPRERASALEVITRNARAQVRLVDDLLDVSAMVRGRLRLQLDRVELRPVVGEALDAARPTAEAKKVALHWHCDPGELVVDGDADRLRQIVHNLLVNAIKFTPENGHVMVRVESRGTSIVISVEDTGIGIDPAFLPQVFERFAQATPGTTRVARGLGLGLAIVRHLVELHGGTVEAASPGPGQGATFTVTLPVAGHTLETPRSMMPGAAALLGLRILFVEDDADTRDLVTIALERSGATVTAVGSVQEALDCLDEARPDLLLSDIGLPHIDGYELVRRLRASGRQIPSIALTAYARPEDRQSALSAGYWHHIGKPVEISELVTSVSIVAAMKGDER